MSYIHREIEFCANLNKIASSSPTTIRSNEKSKCPGQRAGSGCRVGLSPVEERRLEPSMGSIPTRCGTERALGFDRTPTITKGIPATISPTDGRGQGRRHHAL